MHKGMCTLPFQLPGINLMNSSGSLRIKSHAKQACQLEAKNNAQVEPEAALLPILQPKLE